MSLWSNWIAFNNINFLKVMTAIEEKARDFASEFSSQRSLIYGLEKGAEWILEKAVNFIRQHDSEMIVCNTEDDNDSFIAQFIKAMEE